MTKRYQMLFSLSANVEFFNEFANLNEVLSKFIVELAEFGWVSFNVRSVTFTNDGVDDDRLLFSSNPFSGRKSISMSCN